MGKGQGYRYRGRFACPSWEYRKGVDVNGDERRAIVFHLIQPEEAEEEAAAGTTPDSATLSELRQRALDAAAEPKEKDPKEARRRYHQRSAAVRAYVLARAGGTCESCNSPAPFSRQDGTPYLEPHHTRRLSDGGPDDPCWVGAVCPNCHREIHHGAEGGEKNERLQEDLAVLEAT